MLSVNYSVVPEDTHMRYEFKLQVLSYLFKVSFEIVETAHENQLKRNYSTHQRNPTNFWVFTSQKCMQIISRDRPDRTHSQQGTTKIQSFCFVIYSSTYPSPFLTLEKSLFQNSISDHMTVTTDRYADMDENSFS